MQKLTWKGYWMRPKFKLMSCVKCFWGHWSLGLSVANVTTKHVLGENQYQFPLKILITESAVFIVHMKDSEHIIMPKRNINTFDFALIKCKKLTQSALPIDVWNWCWNSRADIAIWTTQYWHDSHYRQWSTWTCPNQDSGQVTTVAATSEVKKNWKVWHVWTHCWQCKSLFGEYKYDVFADRSTILHVMWVKQIRNKTFWQKCQTP